MLDAQLIVKRILEPEKTNLGFVFKNLLPDEEFSEHNALEDARATQRVYEEVKSRYSLDDPGMTKMCPGFDPRRDQVVPENDHTGVSSDFAGGEECLQQSPGQCDAVLKHRLVGLVH